MLAPLADDSIRAAASSRLVVVVVESTRLDRCRAAISMRTRSLSHTALASDTGAAYLLCGAHYAAARASRTLAGRFWVHFRSINQTSAWEVVCVCVRARASQWNYGHYLRAHTHTHSTESTGRRRRCKRARARMLTASAIIMQQPTRLLGAATSRFVSTRPSWRRARARTQSLAVPRLLLKTCCCCCCCGGRPAT